MTSQFCLFAPVDRWDDDVENKKIYDTKNIILSKLFLNGGWF